MARDHQLRGAKVIITGGAGLIGSWLAQKLVELGSDVLLVDSLIPEFGGNLFNIRAIENKLHLNISDIRDVHGMRYLLRDREYLFNLAGQTSHMDSMTAPFDDLHINCEAQLSILEACRQVNPNIRIVFASTRQIYGRPNYLPVDEKHPLKPVDVNGINKIAGESYHLLYNQVYGMRTSVLRLTNTFGPHMRVKDARQIFLGIWVRRLLEGESFEVWGGEQLRDFSYVEDVADAFISAAVSPGTEGLALNVGGVETISLIELAQRLTDLFGKGSFKICEFPEARKQIDIGDYYSDDSEFRRLTGWAPKVDIREGLRRTVEFYKENLAQYL